MKVRPINDGRVAVELLDVDIRTIDWPQAQEIKKLFLQHQNILIRNQSTETYDFGRFIHLMSGHIGNWLTCNWPGGDAYRFTEISEYPNPLQWKEPKSEFPVQRVTGQRVKGSYAGIFGDGFLKWHCNMNNPVHFDSVSLQAIEGCEGNPTIFSNTAPAYEDMPVKLRDEIEKRFIKYTYDPTQWSFRHPIKQYVSIDTKHMYGVLKSHSGLSKGTWWSGDRLWPYEYYMWAVQQNQAGIKGFYYFMLNNPEMNDDEDGELTEALSDWCFRDEYTYTHEWQHGDIMLFDQLICQHCRPHREKEVLQQRVLHRYVFQSTPQEDILKKNYFDGKNSCS